MNRRDSLRLLGIGTLSVGSLLEGCQTKPAPLVDAGAPVDSTGRQDFEVARDKFAAAAVDARAAYDKSEDEAGKAALLLQGIFGSNDDFENVFPMPAGYDPDGSKRAQVTERKPGDRRPTAGDLRFG